MAGAACRSPLIIPPYRSLAAAALFPRRPLGRTPQRRIRRGAWAVVKARQGMSFTPPPSLPPRSTLSADEAAALCVAAWQALQRSDPDRWAYYDQPQREALELVCRRHLRFGARVETAPGGWRVLTLANGKQIAVGAAVLEAARASLRREKKRTSAS